MRLFGPFVTTSVEITLPIFLTARAVLNGFRLTLRCNNSDPTVINLADDPNWGDPAAILQLGNLGDEVLLRDPAGNLVDAIAYGNGHVPGNTTCPLVISSNYSLQRYPYWQDTDQCEYDFREWPLPGPGLLP